MFLTTRSLRSLELRNLKKDLEDLFLAKQETAEAAKRGTLFGEREIIPRLCELCGL